MWLLQGRFAEESRQEVSKLLKYGQTYTLGRKIPADIVIDSKFVSRVSCHITIASGDTVRNYNAYLSNPAAVHNDANVRPRVTIRFEANKSRNTFGVTQQPNSSRRISSSEPVDVQVPANQEHELQDGDSFALTTTISLRLIWKPIAVCFAARVKELAIAPLREPALQLGIHLSPAKSRWADGYTHLCVAQVKPTESVHCALLQARPIVTIEYFQELFRRAELPRHDPLSLETSFDELDCAIYLPTLDQQELSELADVHQKLLPQERRTYMLRGTTCVLFALPNEESELGIYKSILTVAGAHIITHDPQAEHLQTKADFAKLLMKYKSRALSYWRNSGSKARSEAPDEGLVVLIGAAHDNTPWKNACSIACTNLRIAMPTGFHAITNAVFSADVRAHLNTIPNMSDGQEIFMPPAEIPAAPSTDVQASPQRGTDTNMTATQPSAADVFVTQPATDRNRASSITPPAHEAEQPPAAVQEPSNTVGGSSRRPLTRRTRKPVPEDEGADAGEGRDAEISGDQPAMSIAALPDQSCARSDASSSQLMRAERSGLTRRTGTSRAKARRSDIFDAVLLPEASAAAGYGGSHADGSESMAAVASAVPRSRRYRMDLDEEDRAQSESTAQTQESDVRQGVDLGGNSNKRKTPPPQGQEIDVDVGQEADARRHTSTKRSRTAASEMDEGGDRPASQHTVSAHTIRADPATDATGLSQGAQPDSEPQFLQALNTQRAKGKKMDEFDADFNRLRIAKPGTQSQLSSLGGPSRSRTGRTAQQQQQSAVTDVDEDYEAFKQMAEEELRIHVRGNFVQVDFVPLVRQKKAVDERSQTPQGTNGSAGRVPNFKKFRPKCAVSSTNTAGSRLVGANVSQRPQIALVLPESNDYGLGESYWEGQDRQSRPAAESRSPNDQSESAQTSRSKGRPRGRVALDPASVEETAIDLGLDGLDSMESEDEADMTTMLERRHGPRTQRSRGAAATAAVAAARARKRPAALIQDSDDEGGTPSSVDRSTGRKKRASARTATMLIDSDDNDEGDPGGQNDDDGNFAGFGKSTSTRRRRDPPASGTSRTRRTVF